MAGQQMSVARTRLWARTSDADQRGIHASIICTALCSNYCTPTAVKDYAAGVRIGYRTEEYSLLLFLSGAGARLLCGAVLPYPGLLWCLV